MDSTRNSENDLTFEIFRPRLAETGCPRPARCRIAGHPVSLERRGGASAVRQLSTREIAPCDQVSAQPSEHNYVGNFSAMSVCRRSRCSSSDLSTSPPRVRFRIGAF